MMNNKGILAGALLLLFALIATYSNHWQNDFHFDDAHTVQNNIYIQNINNIPLFFQDCKTFSSIPSHGSYRPLVTTTLAIDYHLAKTFSGNGLTPFWFHLFTFLFFILQGVLMYFLFRNILNKVSDQTPNNAIALFATAWYMLHPVQAETINYVISRSDSLSTLFVIAAFVVYQNSAFARSRYLYLIPIIIGCMAKPTVIMFAPMLMIYHLLFEQQQSLFSFKQWQWRHLLKAALPAFTLSIALYLFIKKMEEGMFEPGGTSLFNYAITQPFVYLHYVAMFLLPTQLTADTDWAPFTALTQPKALIGFVFLAALVYTIFYTSGKKHLRPIAFGISWFLLALVPTTLVPLAEVMNDHRQFFPHVGTALALVWALYLLLEKWLRNIPANVITLLLALFLSAYAYGTYQRNKVWRTEETLWKDVTEKSPNNGRGLMNYGLALMGRGDYVGAETYFKRGLALWPYYSYLYINMAIVKEATGKMDEATYYYAKGLEYGRSYPNNYYYYGRHLYKKGRREEAIQNLQECLKMSDAQIDARYLLMDALYETGRYEELKQLCTQTLQLIPNDGRAATYLKIAQSGKSKLQVMEESVQAKPTPEGYLELSLNYYNAGDFDKCIEASRQALKLKPDYAEAWNNICSAYNATNRFKEGADACNQAIKLKPDYTLAKNNLAWALRNIK